MRSQNTKWAELLGNSRRGFIAVSLLANKFSRKRIISRLFGKISQKLKNFKNRRYALLSFMAAVFIMISVPVSLYLKVNASYLELSNEDWTTIPAENVDGLVASVGGELTLDPRNVADDWCDTANCNDTLPYRKLVTINNPGDAVENAKISLDVNYDSDMKADFSDLRFVSKDTESGGSYVKGVDLNYYISTKNSALANFAVEIPNLAPGSQQIFMYYGNSDFGINYSDFKSISSGIRSTCAIGADDKAYCWGNLVLGVDLGSGFSSSSYTPVAVDTSNMPEGLTIKSISHGNFHVCIIASDDNAYCWGSNNQGELGNGSTARSIIPAAVDTSGALFGKSIKSISAGNMGTCAIAGNADNNTDDNAYCWGNGFFASENLPTAVDTSGALLGKSIKSISTGQDFACAIASNDNAYCWGINTYGQLGNSDTNGPQQPTAVDTSGALLGKSIKSISAGGNHTCAIANDDKAYCWGSNIYGQLGNVSSGFGVPVAVDTSEVLSGKSIKSISAGSRETCAIAGNAANNTDDNAYCWGDNTYGQLGNNSTTSSVKPVAVNTSGALDGLTIKVAPTDSQYTTLTAYANQTCVIASNDKAFCWGGVPNSGQGLGNGYSTGSLVPTPVLAINDLYQISSTSTTSSFGVEQNINDSITKTGSLISSIMDTANKPLFGNLSITSSGSGTAQIKVRTDSADDMSTANDWGTCNLLSTGADIYDSTCVHFGDKYLQYQIFMTDDTPVDLTITKISFPFQIDLVEPETNASELSIKTGPNEDNRIITNSVGDGNGFGNSVPPYASWSAAADDVDGIGIGGYCLYLGPDSTPDLFSDSGELPANSSPVDTHGLCQFAVDETNYDISSVIDELSQTTGTIYFAVQAFDKLMNIYPTPEVISYVIDNHAPHAETTLTGPSLQKSKEVTINWEYDMAHYKGFWDEAGESGVVGLKYCIVDMAGDQDNCSDPNINWYGPSLDTGGLDNQDDIFDASTGTLTTNINHPTINDNGINRISVIAIDKAGNTSLPLTVDVTLSPDPTAPIANATNIAIKESSADGSRIIKDSNGVGNGLANGDAPYITWTAAVDDAEGSGIKGYCLTFTTQSDPLFSYNYIGTSSPIDTGGKCGYAVSTTHFQIPDSIISSSREYHFSIKAFDQMHNLFPTATTVTYIADTEGPEMRTVFTGPSGVISSKTITINWLVAEGVAGIIDDHSGVAGLKYCIIDVFSEKNNCEENGDWFGPSGTKDLTDLYPANTGQLITRADDPNITNEGIFIVAIIAVDNIGNSSEPITIIATISDSPATAPKDLTVTPTNSATNNFSFSWTPPDDYIGAASDIDYCWTVNEKITKDASNCHWTGKNVLSLPAGPYATKQKDNIFYLMAKSQAGVYDNESYASAVFNTDTPAPGPPSKLGLTDVSIRDFDNPDNTIWRIAMSWAKPTVSLDLVHNYQIWRSTDGINFGSEAVGSTSITNLSFTDIVPDQVTYYYKVVACDNAGSCGISSNIASKYPTGHFTEPAELTPGSVEVSDISTRRATIKWLTELESDSQVIFDSKPGLNPKKLTEVGDSKTQTKIHSVSLTNLQPGTKYYYQARWTNIDDFTGTSGELSFTTLPAPTISEVSSDNITISGGTINLTVENSSKMNIYYGKTESFGGVKTINTSAAKSNYSIALSDLDDGTKYYFKLNGFDADGNEYQGFVFSFTTLPRPRISNLRFQPVVGASSNTTKVSWITNVPTSSELSYGPVGGAKTETIDTKLVTEHEVTISGLEDDKDHTLVAKSRDSSGNLAISDTQTFRTALDTRPPIISNVIIETSIKGSGAEARGQVVASWTTDEPATSQIAYGQGAPGAYSNKTSEDSRLSSEHVVIISDLATSSIFQVQPLSSDKAKNEAKGINQSAIIGRGSEDVFTIIFNSMRKIFGIR